MNMFTARSDRWTWSRGLAVGVGLTILGAAAPGQDLCSSQELAKVIASDAAASDDFCISIALSGDTAVVGAYLDNHLGGTDAGSVYVFVRSGFPEREVWTQQAKLVASDAETSDYFGRSVAVSGDTLVVGAHQDSHAGGTYAGSAYVFVRSGPPGREVWTEQAKLTASDAGTFDFFGWAVAVSGDSALVGAVWDDHAGGTDAGAAYVFTRRGTVWTQDDKLIAVDAAAFDEFGTSVAVSGDTILVGANSDDHVNVTNAGSAYVFVRSGPRGSEVWTQQVKLVASDIGANDHFGSRIAVSGDTAVIGAYLDNHTGGGDAGSAYVFVRSGLPGPPGSEIWTQQAKLTASDAATGDNFGYSIAVADDTAVIGALNDDHADETNAGSAYVFVRSRLPGPPGSEVWTQRAKLTASDAAASDNFGFSVAIGDQRAVVGAPLDDHAGGNNAGSAYVFDLTVNCQADIDGDCHVNIDDLFAVIAAWGPCARCPEDIEPSEEGDGDVDIDDLFTVIAAWGPCP